MKACKDQKRRNRRKGERDNAIRRKKNKTQKKKETKNGWFKERSKNVQRTINGKDKEKQK